MDVQTILILVFSGFLVCLYLLLSAAKVKLLEPSKIFIIPWLINSIVLLSGMVIYGEVFSLVTFLITIFGILLFITGTQITRMFYGRSNRNIPFVQMKGFSNVALIILIPLALTYLVIQLKDIIDILRSGMFEDLSLAILRERHWESFQDGTVGILRVITSISRVAALIVALGLPYFFKNEMKALFFLSIACSLELSLEVLLHGGRFTIVFLLVSWLYAGAIIRHFRASSNNNIRPHGDVFNKHYKRRFRVFSLIFLPVMIFLMFVVFPLERNPQLADNAEKVLRYGHDAEIAEWVTSVGNVPGLKWVPIFAYGTNYLSTPIVKFTFFTSNSDIENWYYLGRYNAPIFSKSWSAISGDVDSWLMVRERIATISESHGFNPNPWATGIRDLVIDFGYVGALLLMFIMGLGVQWIYEKANYKRTLEWVILSTITGVGTMIFAYLSPFVIGVVVNSLLMCAVLIMARRFVISKRILIPQ